MIDLIELAERRILPDALIRVGMRRLLRERLATCRAEALGEGEAGHAAFVRTLSAGPVALVPEKANEQHYEVPPAFFSEVLGPHRKYSCCLFDAPGATLEDAEAAMLALTCERAQLADGMDILELGCGWGSLTLWMAEHYATARIVAVSNSAPQREFIVAEAARRGLENVDVRTCDMNEFDPGARFDRVVSVEMFEHMRNWREIFRRVGAWLRPDGRLFLHVFCHRRFAYPFDTEGASNWMGRHFFSGGIMPSENLAVSFQEDLRVREQWYVNGAHYRDTCEAWLRNCDARKTAVLAILSETCGAQEAPRSLQRWRMFFMACAELFGYRGGEEWGVGHYLLAPR